MRLPRRNHQAKAIVATIVGMMIASMIAVELMRIGLFGLADGPDRIEDAAVAAGEEQERRKQRVPRRAAAHFGAIGPTEFTSPRSNGLGEKPLRPLRCQYQ